MVPPFRRVAQLPLGAEEQGADLRGRHVQGPADRAVVEVAEVAEHERKPVLLGQGLDGGEHPGARFRAHQLAQGGGARVGEVGGVQVAGLKEPAFHAAASEPVDTVVLGDGEQPGPKGSAPVVAREGGAGAQEDLLGGVLRGPAGPEQSAADAGDVGLLGGEERREGLGIPAAGALDPRPQGFVAHAPSPRRLAEPGLAGA
jgi:hypothetical protein